MNPLLDAASCRVTGCAVPAATRCDPPGGQRCSKGPWPGHGRARAMSRRAEIVAISLSYVRMASLAVERWKDETPGDLRLAGVSCVGRQGAAALRRMSKSTQVASVALFTWPTRARKWRVIFMMGVIIRRDGWLYKRWWLSGGWSSQRSHWPRSVSPLPGTCGAAPRRVIPLRAAREDTWLASAADATAAYAGAAPGGIASAAASLALTDVSCRSYVPISRPLAMARDSSRSSTASRPGESGRGSSPPRANTWNA